MTKQGSLLKPSIELIFAALFWGFGFVATVWVLPFLSPAAIISMRFLTSALISVCIFPFLDLKQVDLKSEFKFSIPAGILIGLCLFLQTYGLQFTTATNSGFITTLYVVFVPLVAALALKEKLSWMHLLFVFTALVGTGFIIQIGKLDLNLGDFLTLACALVATIQIVYIGWISDRTQNAFVFNGFQSFWAGLPFLCEYFVNPTKWQLANLDTRAWVGIVSLTLGSTVIAFFLQVRAQKQISSALASLLFLLESPFSFLFASIFLKESMSLSQSFGAVLILLSCGGAVWLESRKHSRAKV